MSKTIQGISIVRGIAIGKIHIIDNAHSNIEKNYVKDISSEVRRLEDAINKVEEEFQTFKRLVPISTPTNIIEFFDAHLLMIKDQALFEESEAIIKEFSCNAEWSLKQYQDTLNKEFEEIKHSYLKTRIDDINHVINAIIRALLQQKPLLSQNANISNNILFAYDLMPIDIMLIQQRGFTGFLTVHGTPTSHAAILARSLDIPAIVGLHEAEKYLHQDDTVIIDGDQGLLIINPDEDVKAQYDKKLREQKNYCYLLDEHKNVPAKTTDGTEIKLMVNIELTQDFDLVKGVGADGVGLYRTEFLYANRATLPDEEEHFNTYKKIIKNLNGLPLTIRTFDANAENFIDFYDRGYKANPALGLRSIRFCLKNIDLFVTQLRAILRASIYGPIRLMIPMLTSIEEMEQVFDIIQSIGDDLRQAGIAFEPDMKIGGMIETPAAAICTDIFADQLDFISIGTNDLIQYTMAIDRVSDETNYLYDPLHPAIIRLIQNIIAMSKQSNILVSMCGEMASEPQYTQLLLGLGLREFSVHASMLLEVKQVINNSHIPSLEKMTDQVLKCKKGSEIRQLLSNS